MSNKLSCERCGLENCLFRESVTVREFESARAIHGLTGLDRGGRIWQSGNGCRHLWIVVDGLAALSTALADGRRQITGLISSGDVICPVSDKEGTESWAEALSPVQVCEIDLRGMINGGDHSDAIWGSLFRATHQQLERSNINLVMLGRFDGMERICLFLAEMARRIGIPGPGGHRVHLPMSREDIADYLGLNAETVSRLLTRVRKMNLATFISPTDFVVHDIDALAQRTPTSGGKPPPTQRSVLRRFSFSSPFKMDRMEAGRSSDK